MPSPGSWSFLRSVIINRIQTININMRWTEQEQRQLEGAKVIVFSSDLSLSADRESHQIWPDGDWRHSNLAIVFSRPCHRVTNSSSRDTQLRVAAHNGDYCYFFVNMFHD